MADVDRAATPERDTVTIWSVYSWTCPSCESDVLTQTGESAPNNGDEIECDACGAVSLAGETR